MNRSLFVSSACVAVFLAAGAAGTNVAVTKFVLLLFSMVFGHIALCSIERLIEERKP